MRHSTGFRTACLLLAAAGILAMPPLAQANPIVPVTLDFEHEGLDLDTGTIVEIDRFGLPADRADPQPDLVLACNSERTLHAVVFHHRMNGVKIAFLDGVPFNVVDSADLAGLSFTAEVVDIAFEPGSSVVLRTDTGAYYLLGNPIEDAEGVTFDTLLLEQTVQGPVLPATEEDGDATVFQAGAGFSRVIEEDAKLTAGDGAFGDDFGAAVAVDGDLAVVGAPRDDDNGIDSGSVYVFVRDGTTWTERAKLTASDATAYAWFGSAVAISGETVVVGTERDDQGGTNAGAIYVFARDGTTWVEQGKLVASDAAAGDEFGRSVDAADDTVLAGAPLSSHSITLSQAGSSYVFQRTGTTWTEQARLRANDPRELQRFGSSVSLSGNRALIGAYNDLLSRGSAYVFVHTGTGWLQQAKLRPGDAAIGDEFGWSVGLSGSTAVVGARSDDDGGNASGSAYIFVRMGSAGWVEQSKLLAGDGAANHRFGQSAAIFGDTVVVGVQRSNGAAYLFVRNGTDWNEQFKLTASDGSNGDVFGKVVEISSDTAIVGAVNNDGAADRTGSAYSYRINRPVYALCRDTIVVASPDCTADGSIDGGSFDPEGGAITLEQSPAGPYPLGTTRVTLTVTDDQGGVESCEADLTVRDTTPPTVQVTSLDPDTLWPPDHQLVAVEASVIAADDCSAPFVALDELRSNEADDAPGAGDGTTTGDTQPGPDEFHFSLRAERANTGSGRIYTAVYVARDGSGNVARAAGFAVVPHDQGVVADPVQIILEESASGTLVSWSTVPGVESYDVIRGELDNVVETETVIDLGQVLCIEGSSTDSNTLDREDLAVPAPGKAFFYLVEYDDGVSSTYGTESAGKPRAPGPGGCQ